MTRSHDGHESGQPRSTRRSRRPRRAFFDFVIFVTFVAVIFVPFAARPGAQGDPTDADLEAASGGRVIRVGALATDGHVIVLPLEIYIARVLAGEGEPRAAEAAQQALAIAIRTYAIANLNRH